MSIISMEDYFEDRINKLSDSLNTKSKKYEHNRIEIAELGNKIKEFETAYDEGFEMFSPIVATDASFNNQEIKNLKMKIYLLIEDNNLLDTQMTEIKDELDILRKFHSERKQKEQITSTLHSDKTIKYPGDSTAQISQHNSDLKSVIEIDEIINSIERCIDYCNIDIFRTKIELNNLLDKLNQLK